ALLLLVMGMAWEDLFWAFQVGWLASVAFGLGALLALQMRRRWRAAAATGLVVVSLSFSGVGLVFAVAAAIHLLLTPTRRNELWWFVPMAISLLAWYTAFGRFGTHPDPQPTAANLLFDPLYTVWGLSQGIAGVIGVSGWFGYPLLGLAIVAVAWSWKRHGLDPFLAGIGAGLVAFLLVAGLTRAQLGWQRCGGSRFVFVADVRWLWLRGGWWRYLRWGVPSGRW